ncbi:MAG TPA: serine hydrolase [Trueperaceae bacterium]
MDTSRLEEFVFEKMARTRLPGLSLALVADEELRYARGFGQRDLDDGRPATPNTLYSIGSVTKSFTALAVLQLVERGVLDLSDPVEKHLPYDIRPKGGTVRLEHLLTHSSGIPALAYSEAVIGHANGTGGRPLPIGGPEDVLTFMSGSAEWAESLPGERWAYANEGYALLGLIVEEVSGQKYEEYLRQNVLRPLGMERSFFARSEVEADADVAVPYVLPADAPPRPGRYLYRNIRSEGGLISNVLDLARYLRVFLAGGAGVVEPGSVEAMMRPRVDGPFRRSGLAGEPAGDVASGWGFGLVAEELLGRKMVGHGGSVLVSTAYLAFLPEDGLGVAVLANASGYPLRKIARAALATMLGEGPEVVPAVKVESELESVCGRYRGFRGAIEATVEREGDFLRLRFDGSAAEQAILVPEQLTGRELRFFTLTDGLRLPVVIRRSQTGTELLFERHKLRRTGE